MQPANYVVGWDLVGKLKYIFYEIKRGIYRHLCGKEIYCYSGCYIGCIRSEHWSVFFANDRTKLKDNRVVIMAYFFTSSMIAY